MRTPAQWKADAPAPLTRTERTSWSKARHAALLAGHIAALNAHLSADGDTACEVLAADGRLPLLLSGQIAVELFDKPETPFIAAQWRHALRGFHGDAKRLLQRLLKLRTTPDASLRDAVIRLDADLSVLESDITSAEAEMNALVFSLYALTPNEQAQILKG